MKRIFVIVAMFTDYKGSSVHVCGAYPTKDAAVEALPSKVLDRYSCADIEEWECDWDDSFNAHYHGDSKEWWVRDDGDSIDEFWIQETLLCE